MMQSERLRTDLFEEIPDVRVSQENIAEGAVLLRGFAKPVESVLIAALRDIVNRAPFRHMMTPGGHRMSVAMTNCGSVGWVTDATGYRYDANDPESGKPWPAMPPSFCRLARQAAVEAGFNFRRIVSPPSEAAWGMGSRSPNCTALVGTCFRACAQRS